MNDIPSVLQAIAGKNYNIYLYFNDGTVRMFDAEPLVRRGGVFAPLQNAEFFKNRLTVLNNTAAWDLSGEMDPCRCIDLDPCELYDNSPIVIDPLESAS